MERSAWSSKEDVVEDGVDDSSSRRLGARADGNKDGDEYLARPSRPQQITVLVCAFLVTFLILGTSSSSTCSVDILKVLSQDRTRPTASSRLITARTSGRMGRCCPTTRLRSGPSSRLVGP
jgi:hypothetical protein